MIWDYPTTLISDTQTSYFAFPNPTRRMVHSRVACHNSRPNFHDQWKHLQILMSNSFLQRLGTSRFTVLFNVRHVDSRAYSLTNVHRVACLVLI